MAVARREEYGSTVTGEEKPLNAAMESIKQMHELNRDDPRAKQILERLLVVWRERNPSAKPDAKPGDGGKK